MKYVKRFFSGLAGLILLFVIAMLIPRLWSAMNPGKPPVGYFYRLPTIIAVYSGLESLISRTPPMPEGVDEFRNIEYKNINGKSLQLDLYKQAGVAEKLPLLVFIHGGGWRSGQREDYLVYMTHFVKMGYVTATVSYRLLKDAPYPACVEDISDAVEWFYDHADQYNYDPERICLIGGSAGAHLAMLAGYGWREKRSGNKLQEVDSVFTDSGNPSIKAVVAIYGPTDFTTEYVRTHPTITGFIAKTYEEAPELYTEASPVSYVDSSCPPTLIIQGTADDLVPVSQAELLRDRLKSHSVPYIYLPFPGWPHTMDMVKRVNDYFKVTLNDFFGEYVTK